MPKPTQKRTVSRLRVPPPVADEFVNGGADGQLHTGADAQKANGASGQKASGATGLRGRGASGQKANGASAPKRAPRGSVAPPATGPKERLHVMIPADLWSWSAQEAAKTRGVNQGDIVAEALALLRSTREKR